MNEKDYPIVEEHLDYYEYLEELRKSGATNMYGAVPYLEFEFNLDRKMSKQVLMEWMKNYDELKIRCQW